MKYLLDFEPDEGNGNGGALVDPPAESQVDAPDDSQGGDSTDDDLDVGDAELKKVRREAQNLRARLKAAEAKVAKHKAEGLSDVEQARQEAATAKQEATDLLAKNRVLLVAALAPSVGIADGTVAAKLIDFDELGDPSDESEIKSALKALVKKHPFLAGNVAAGANGGDGEGRRDRAAGDNSFMNQRLRDAAGRTRV